MVQVNPVQQSVMAYGIVPQGVSEQSGGQSFASNVFEAETVIPNGMSIFVI
jgi:hypothetical protein